jgi:hypothetical protein
MNGDPLTPAIIAGGAGATLMATVWAHERRQDEAMRKSFVRLAMRFPFGADPVRARVALGAISGGSNRNECVFEVTLTADGVRHYLLVPTAVRESVTSAFVGALPGLRFSEVSPREGKEAVAVRVAVRPGSLSSESPGATLPVLAALSLGASEQLTLRWAVRPGTPRAPRPSERGGRMAKDAERAWREKTAHPTFRVEGLLLARAAGRPRARGLAEHAASLIRSRRSSAGVLGLSVERRARNMGSLPRTTQRSGWLNTAELLPCLMLPLGDYLIPGVEVGATRALPVPRHVPREGLRLCVGRDSGGERPVAVSIEAARTHTCLLGGSGSGKSAALCWIALQLVAQGYGGVLIDPKADLVAELLDRIPAADADRVVVLDPAERGALPGLDLFGGGDPVLRSDVILSVLRGLSESWGPRIDRYLGLGLRTVAALPNPVLSDWLRLYSDPNLRRAAIARLDDPIAIEEWRTYEALSPSEQTQFIAPAAARISGLLSRPALRAILNQPSPRLNIAQLLEERKLVAASLAPGVLGEPAAHLLGAIVTYLTWSAVEARVAVPPHARRPVFLLMDEMQSLVHLPVGVEVFFERTRGLGCGVVVATQGLARLPESARQSLLTNVGSVLAFKAGSEEATRVARELPGLEAGDIMGLGRYECAARIATVDAGIGSAVITGRTEPLPPITGQASVIRAASASRYGRDPAEVEAELHRRLGGSEPESPPASIGRTGRSA